MPQHNVQLHSKSKRLKLVPPSSRYDEQVSAIRSHAEFRRFLQFFPQYVSPEEVAKRREERAEDPTIVDLCIMSCNDGKWDLAGMTGIFHIDTMFNSCEVGVVVSHDFYGRNIATDALYTLLEYVFEERKIHRATFETSVENIHMRGWLERVAGAKLEAERRDCWKIGEDTYVNVMSYCILDWEWKGHVKSRLQNRLGLLPGE